MTRMRVGVAALVVMVAVALFAGVAPAAVAQEDPADAAEDAAENATEDGEESKTEEEDDPVLELQQEDGAHIDTIERYDEYAMVTIDTEEPIVVTYPTQTREEIEANSAREIIAQEERIPEGETEIRVALTGESVFFGVGGSTVQVSGEKSSDAEIVTTLESTPSLVVGAVFGVGVAGIIAYRRRQKQLEEPIRASEVWRRK